MVRVNDCITNGMCNFFLFRWFSCGFRIDSAKIMCRESLIIVMLNAVCDYTVPVQGNVCGIDKLSYQSRDRSEFYTRMKV